MRVLENTLVKDMMQAYVELLNNADYQKIESFVEKEGGLTSSKLKITAEAVSTLRRFVDINLANPNANHENIDWRGINSISSLTPVGNSIVTQSTKEGTTEIINDWQTWADGSMPSAISENLTGVNAEVVSVWFFNNAAKTYNKFREVLTIMGSATENKSVFSDVEQANRSELKTAANNLLPQTTASSASGSGGSAAPTASSSSAAVLSKLGNQISMLCPQSLEKDSYQVLRYTYSKWRSWGKSAGRGDLLQLKGTLTQKTKTDMAKGNWLTSEYITMLANEFSHIEERLGISNQVQVQLMSNDALIGMKLNPSQAVNINVEGKSVVTSIFSQIRDLALLKSSLGELNRQVLKNVTEWQFSSQISAAEANLAQASTQLVFNAAAGITGFFSEKASSSIKLIGEAQQAMFDAITTYPAEIEAAQVQYLRDQYTRIEDYLEMIIANYQLTRDFVD